MYTVMYERKTGIPASINKDDVLFIPINNKHMDFIEFLDWNSQQVTPLDYTTPIAPQPPLAVQQAIRTRKVQARTNAKNVPDWATWTDEQALAWLKTNIGDPLDTPIPPNPMTVQQIRQALVLLVDIMKKQYVWDQASTRMTLAERDELWPDLPNN